jgi:hypothetical protein
MGGISFREVKLASRGVTVVLPPPRTATIRVFQENSTKFGMSVG